MGRVYAASTDMEFNYMATPQENFVHISEEEKVTLELLYNAWRKGSEYGEGDVAEEGGSNEEPEGEGAATIKKVWAKNSSNQYVETEGFKNYPNGIPAGTWYEVDQEFGGIRHRFAIQADMYDWIDTNWRNNLMIQIWNAMTESWDAFSGTEHWNIKNVTIDGVAAVEYNTKVLGGNAKYRFTLPPQAMS